MWIKDPRYRLIWRTCTTECEKCDPNKSISCLEQSKTIYKWNHRRISNWLSGHIGWKPDLTLMMNWYYRYSLNLWVTRSAPKGHLAIPDCILRYFLFLCCSCSSILWTMLCHSSSSITAIRKMDFLFQGVLQCLNLFGQSPYYYSGC